jgi:23S rRNA pseudouridine955/2504/2580 synthase
MTLEKTVTIEDDDTRLDRWVKRRVAPIPQGMLEKLLRKGAIRVDGAKLASNGRVRSGQKITLSAEVQNLIATLKGEAGAKAKPVISDEDRTFIRKQVIFENRQIIVLNKPAGLAVQGGTKIRRSVDDLSAALVGKDEEKPKLVHRLDRETSGVLVLAKNSAIAKTLAKFFASRGVEKYYWALVAGIPEVREGKVDLPLAKGSEEAGGYESIGVEEEEGKRALTYYRVRETLGKHAAWVELKPVTGRMHQLRVHMQAIGHPIIGDPKYGGWEEMAALLPVSKGLHLHARRLVISDMPGGKLDMTAPLPRHMRESFTEMGFDLEAAGK